MNLLPSTSSSNILLRQLPNELLIEIFSYLNYSQLAKLKLSCKKFYNLILCNSALLNRPKLNDLCLSLIEKIDPNFGRFVAEQNSTKKSNKTKLQIRINKKIQNHKSLILFD